MNRFVSALILFLLMTGAVSSQETATEVMPAKVADGSAAKDATNKSADQKPPVADKRVNTGEDSKQTDDAAAKPTNGGGTESERAIAQLAKLQEALIAGRIDKETYERLKSDLLEVQKQNNADSQSSAEGSVKGGHQSAESRKSVTKATGNQTKAAWDEIGQIDVELRSIAQRDPAGYYEQLYVQYARINTDYVDDDLRQIVQDRIRVFMNLHSSVVEYLDERAKIVKGVDAASQFGAAVGSTNQNNPQGNAAAGAIVFGLIGSAVADTQLKEINAKYGPKILSLEAEANETESRLQSLGPQLTEKYGLQFSQRSATAIGFLNSAIAWFRMGEYEKSLADLNEAIRLDPKLADAYGNRAVIWIYKGDVDRALNDLNEAIKLEPQLSNAYNIRGEVWVRIGDFNRAVEDLNEAIRLEPKLAGAYSNRGLVWGRKGEHDKAIADFNEAIRLDPKLAGAYFYRSGSWLYKGESDKALIDLNDAIQLDPKFSASYTTRGRIWFEKGDFDHAISDFKEAIRLDAGCVEGYNALGWLMATCPDEKYRDGKQAVEYAKKACDLTTGNERYILLDTLAAAYAEAGDFAHAVEMAEMAVKSAREPQKAEFQSHLHLFKSGKPYREERK